jgi:hypothetical protein
MAERYFNSAGASGNWSTVADWDGGVSLPGVGDDVYANGKTVTIDQDVTVLSLRTTAGTTAVAGGGFTCSTTRTVALSGAGLVPGSSTCLTFSGASGQTLTGSGTVTGGASGITNALSVTSSGTCNWTGNVTGGTSGSCRGAVNSSTGTLNIVGNATGGTQSSTYAVGNTAGGTLTLTGDATGGSAGTAHGVLNNGAGAATITGNVTGGSSTAHGAFNNAGGTLTINGDLIPSAVNSAVSWTANTSGKIVLNGNIQSNASGVPPFGNPGHLLVIKSTTTLTHSYRTDDGGSIGAERILSTSGSGQGVTVPLSDQGSLVTGSTKSTGTTLSTPSSITASSGQLIVAVVATDNEATADGETSLHTALTVGGHSATKIKEYTNTVGGAANDGVTTSLWYLIAPEDITSGASVVSTLNSGKDAKAVCGHVFDLDSAYSVSIDGTGTLANDNADPGSLSATGTLNVPHLWVRGIGVETDNTTAGTLTPTSGWTAMTGTGTTGGAAATNVSVRGEFKIANGTASGASDPTLVSADGASVLGGLALSIPEGVSATAPASASNTSFGPVQFS